MILINIETLSDSELRYIAQQENLEDWESLSREDLIEELEEFYEEDNSEERELLNSEKFTKTLTSTPSDNVLQFPGVDPIPEFYNETSIHAVLRDNNWAYVFWNISKNKREEIETSDSTLILRTFIEKENFQKEHYDIEISLTDDNWNIELPWNDCRYQVKLYEKTKKSEEKLCETQFFSVSSSYYTKHPELLKDKDIFEIVLNPLISKNGNTLNNSCVRALVDASKEV